MTSGRSKAPKCYEQLTAGEFVRKDWSLESEEKFIHDMFEITNSACIEVAGSEKCKRLFNPSNLLQLYFRSKQRYSATPKDERIAILDDIARKIFNAVAVCVLDAFERNGEKQQCLSVSETDFVRHFYCPQDLDRDNRIVLSSDSVSEFWDDYRQRLDKLVGVLEEDIKKAKEEYWKIVTKNDFLHITQMYTFPYLYDNQSSQGIILFKYKDSEFDKNPGLTSVPHICRTFLHGIDVFSSQGDIPKNVEPWSIPLLIPKGNRCCKEDNRQEEEESHYSSGLDLPSEVDEKEIKNCTSARFSAEAPHLLRILFDVRNEIHRVLTTYGIETQDYLRERSNADESLVKELITLFMYKGEEKGFRWFYLPRQEEKLKALPEIGEKLYKKAVHFRFIDSGLISYLTDTTNGTKRLGEFIINFRDEHFLIDTGYKVDEQAKVNSGISANDIEALESSYPDVDYNPYYYFKLLDNPQSTVFAIVCLPHSFLDSDLIPDRCRLFIDLDELMSKWRESLQAITTVRTRIRRDAETALRSARQAAIAAIMSRNMSHNIGSHVLDYWSNDIRDDSSGIHGKHEAQMVDYLRSRMAFIASVITQPPFSSGTVSLKRVIDQQVPDLLKGKIAWSEKECIIVTEYDGDANIDIPYGEVGKHALFSIIENVMRNSAKHSDVKIKDGYRILKIQFRVESYNDDLWNIAIEDDALCDVEPEKLQTLIDEKASRIFNPETGEVERELWGFKEMIICAAFLRNTSYEQLQEVQTEPTQEQPKLLEITKTTEGHLCHNIYVLKPKEVLIVSSKDWELTDDERQQLARQGIEIKGLEWVKENLKSEMIRHRFTVLIGNEVTKYFTEWKDCLPCRTICLEDEMQSKLCSTTKNSLSSPHLLINWLYKFWFNRELGRDISNLPQIAVVNSIWDSSVCDGVVVIKDSPDDNSLLERIGETQTIVFEHPGDHDRLSLNSPQIQTMTFFHHDGSPEENVLKALSSSNPEKSKRTRYELIEAALIRILIMDERLWEKYGQGDEWHWLHKKGITLVGPWGEKADEEDEWAEIVHWDVQSLFVADTAIVREQAIDISDYQILFMHQGLIDKDLYVKQAEEAEQKGERIQAIADAFKSKVRWMFIHSGRGYPSFIPDGVKFTAYETLEDLIRPSGSPPDRPFKHTVIQGVMKL